MNPLHRRVAGIFLENTYVQGGRGVQKVRAARKVVFSRW